MEFNYDLVVGVCNQVLIKQLKERHLEDMIQYVSMKYWESGCKANLKWLCLNYLRDNGYGKRGKLGAMAIEKAMSISIPDNGEDKDQTFLIESIDNEKWISQEDEDNHRGEIEEILSPILPNQTIFNWAMKHWKPARRLVL